MSFLVAVRRNDNALEGTASHSPGVQDTEPAKSGKRESQNAADVTGVPEVGGNYTINGRTYTASEVGSLTGKTHFNTVALYVGIGWGNPVYGCAVFGVGSLGHLSWSRAACGVRRRP
jgi:hypothetical protein